MLKVCIAVLALVVAAPVKAGDVREEFDRRHHQMMMEFEASEANKQARQREIDEDLTHYYMRNPPERGVGF
jgi:hypothetical protein